MTTYLPHRRRSEGYLIEDAVSSDENRKEDMTTVTTTITTTNNNNNTSQPIPIPSSKPAQGSSNISGSNNSNGNTYMPISPQILASITNTSNNLSTTPNAASNLSLSSSSNLVNNMSNNNSNSNLNYPSYNSVNNSVTPSNAHSMPAIAVANNGNIDGSTNVNSSSNNNLMNETQRLQKIQRERESIVVSNSTLSSTPSWNFLPSHATNSITTELWSEPISLRGYKAFVGAFLTINIGMLLVRDSTLLSFLLYLIVLNAALVMVMIWGNPFSFGLQVRVVSNQQHNAMNVTAPSSGMSITPRSMQVYNERPRTSGSGIGTPKRSSVRAPTAPLPPLSVSTKPTTLSSTSLPVIAPKITVPAAEVIPSLPHTPSRLSASPSPYDYGSWTVPPLPSIVRGFKRKIVAGSSLKQVTQPTPGEPSWNKVDGATFMVRCGPNYRRNKMKASSTSALYECIGVDVFVTECKIDHIARCIKLPFPKEHMRKRAKSSTEDDGDFSDSDGEYEEPAEDVCGAPRMWVIQFQFPNYAPSLLTKKEDGKGYSIVMYFELTARGRQELQTNQTPAAKLFKDFVENCADESWHQRYKCIPRIANPDELVLGRTVRGILTRCNGKPFLTGPWCHSFLKGPGYMEVDIDVHRFRYVAKQGVWGFMDALRNMEVDFGFCVEAHEEEEMPEQIMSCCKMNYPDPAQAQTIQYYLAAAQQQLKSS